jgi:hypothetical protein
MAQDGGGGGQAKFAENLCASSSNKDISNKATVRQIHLDGQYLKIITETVAELEKALREQKRMEELILMFDIAVELNMYPSRYIFYIYLFKLNSFS